MVTIARAAVLSAVIVGGGLYARSGGRERPVSRTPLASIPCVLDAWRCTGDSALDADSLAVLRADDYVNRGYVDRDGHTAALFVAYYDSQREGDAIHSPQNCLPGSGWEPLTTARVNLGLDGAPSPANEMIVQKALDRQVVVYWYEGRGRRIADEYLNRFWLVVDAVRLHRSNGALVRIVSSTAESSERFARAVSPHLSSYLP